MERGGVRQRLLLPRPGARLERQRRDVVEFRQLEEGRAPDRRVPRERLGEVPGGSRHDEEVIVAVVSGPDLGGIAAEEVVEIEAVFGAGIDVGAVEESEGVDSGVVGEVDGVGTCGVRSEAGVLEDPTVENELEHVGVGSVPAVGSVVGLGAESVVGDVWAEILVDWVVRATAQEIQIETGREFSDVDPTSVTLSSSSSSSCLILRRLTRLSLVYKQ